MNNRFPIHFRSFNPHSGQTHYFIVDLPFLSCPMMVAFPRFRMQAKLLAISVNSLFYTLNSVFGPLPLQLHKLKKMTQI